VIYSRRFRRRGWTRLVRRRALLRRMPRFVKGPTPALWRPIRTRHCGLEKRTHSEGQAGVCATSLAPTLAGCDETMTNHGQPVCRDRACRARLPAGDQGSD
jgi:hypothetical protein